MKKRLFFGKSAIDAGFEALAEEGIWSEEIPGAKAIGNLCSSLETFIVHKIYERPFA